MTRHIVYVAGRSGGHIIPALTLAKQEQNAHKLNVSIIITDATLDQKMVTANNIPYHTLPIGSLSRTRYTRYPLYFFTMIWSVFKSMHLLISKKADSVVSMGGYVSIPVCFAAKLLGIPFDVYELNVQPGLAVKILAPFARHVRICFDQTKRYLQGNNVVVTTYPVRFAAAAHLPQGTKDLSNGNHHKKKILILGGSQGSSGLNALIKKLVLQFTSEEKGKYSILHQSGPTDAHDLHCFYAKQQIEAVVHAFIDEPEKYLLLADYVITRAGSGALHEIEFFRKPALIIPLETSTNNHQLDNAKAFFQKNSTLWHMIHQKELESDAHLLATIIRQRVPIN